MPMAAVPALSQDHPAPHVVQPIVAEKNSTTAMYLAWFRSEFAAANAIIDALCGHLAQVSDEGLSGYQAVFGAIHRRRLNWIPVLQMQKYHSIAEVVVELQKLADEKIGKETTEKNEDDQEIKEVDKKLAVEKIGKETTEKNEDDQEIKEVDKKAEEESLDEKKFFDENVVEKLQITEKVMQSSENDHAGKEIPLDNEDSANSENTNSGSDGMQPISVGNAMCTNHEDCEARPAQIKLTKGFSAKEFVKGNMVNVVKGLKLYENIFTDSELSKLNDFVNDLRVAGQNGELLGETFILFNQQVKGSRRELVQLGVPIFSQIKEDTTVNIEPIPVLLHAVIDHLAQWQLISEHKKPNGCIINFFEEEEHSQPFQKPPHLDQPIVTLFLSKSTVVFGRTLVGDNKGNYKGPLMLCLKKGSLLVMRGHSADMARHLVCPSPEKRVSITFFRVRPDANQCQHGSTSPPTTSAMTLWQPAVPSSYGLPNGSLDGCGAMDVMPTLGLLCAPVLTLAPMVFSPSNLPPDGTGVYLPWSVGSRKHAKYLPPCARARARARQGRLLALTEANPAESTPEP